jgi:hypothetical protein
VIPGRQFQFAGTIGETGGVDIRVEYRSLAFFGELACSKPGIFAVVAGGTISLSPSWTVMVVFREFPPAFSSLHARSFGEHADGRNEQGIYYAWDMAITRQIRISGFYDQYKFPWRTYLVPLPTTGQELQTRLDASPTNALEMSYLYSRVSNEDAMSSEDNCGRDVKVMHERKAERHRVTAAVRAAPRLRFRGRVDWKSVRNQSGLGIERGSALSVEVRYEDIHRFVIETGLAYFDTDSYDARISAYEHDLQGVFCGPSFSGQGRRWYVLGEWKITRWLHLSAKYSGTEKAESSAYQASVQLSLKF